MANVPLVSNPIFPPVPDEPKLDTDAGEDNTQKLQEGFDNLWKWMKDLSVQLKILFGSPQASNSAITIPLVQAGTILPFGGPSANIPSGYLPCDGSEASQTQYPGLFLAIGSTWNTGGEGAGNFRLPNLNGRVLIGSGTGSGLSSRTLGQTGGEETHVLSLPETPVHSHGAASVVTDPGHSHSVNVSNVPAGVAANLVISAPTGSASIGIDTTGITVATSVGNAGSGGAHNNMQPFGVVTLMIKY